VAEGEDGEVVAARFAALHAQRNGFTLGAPVEVIGVRHVASGPAHPVCFERVAASRWTAAHQVDDGGVIDARLAGPSVVVLPGATLRIAAGWTGVPHSTGGWLLQRDASA
jgi:N-methylhydantoinase A